MCKTQLTPFAAAEVAALNSPEGLAALDALQSKGILQLTQPDVDALVQDKASPLYAKLNQAAFKGGPATKLQVVILLTLIAGLIGVTSFSEQGMSLVNFALWGGVGVVTALLLRAHPGLRTGLK